MTTTTLIPDDFREAVRLLRGLSPISNATADLLDLLADRGPLIEEATA